MLPSFRTEDYAIWRACERLHIRPPDVKDWDECDIWTKALLIAYNQIRCYEEQDRDVAMANAGVRV